MISMSDINDVLENLVEKYKKAAQRENKSLENILSSRVQSRILRSEVLSFQQEVNSAMKSSISAEDSIELLNQSFQQLIKFISDKPEVIDFEIEKIQNRESQILSFIEDVENAENELKKRKEKLEEIKQNLENDPTSYDKRKIGKRPENWRDIRIVKKSLEESQKNQTEELPGDLDNPDILIEEDPQVNEE